MEPVYFRIQTSQWLRTEYSTHEESACVTQDTRHMTEQLTRCPSTTAGGEIGEVDWRAP